jgi:hypothetical protein
MRRDPDQADFETGDPVVVVGTPDDGELGTVIALVWRPDGLRYQVVFETGREARLPADSLRRRR